MNSKQNQKEEEKKILSSEEKFKLYDGNSNEITIYYNLEKYIENCERWTKINLDAYANEFSSIINKDNFHGYETFNKSDTLKEIKKRVSEKTGFPIETIIKFGKYGGQEYDDKQKKWTIVEYYTTDENILIGESIYNSIKIDDRKVYIYIDPSKSEIFASINKNQIKNDVKINDMEKKMSNLNRENKQAKQEINNLKNNQSNLQRQVSLLDNENLKLKKKQEEEDKIKKKKEMNRINCKTAFNQDKNDIKKKVIEDSKKDIIKIILKNVKELESKNNSLPNYISKFTEVFFMTYNKIFIEEFSKNSEKIINEYDVNKNKIHIEHINFIVIGAAGSGKSTFINEALKLPENRKAKEDIGESCTNKSTLYNSDKLTMIRMWDTQGLDYKITQPFILSEIKRIVEEGLNNGPDNYINVILYCTKGERFQEEDGKLINDIMKIYPADNLPVIITQLQAYIKEDVAKMKKRIKEILSKYLENQIVDKIEIRDVISKAKIINGQEVKEKGISELLKCSFDVMGRAITSATCKKFSEDIEKLCKEYVENKLDDIKKIFKDEIELLEKSKNIVNDEDEDEKDNKKYNVKLSRTNKYLYIKDKLFFVNEFVSILKTKIEKVYIVLNNISLKSDDYNEKSVVSIFLEDRLEIMKKSLKKMSEKIFTNIYKAKFSEYFQNLQMKQSTRNKEYDTNNTINDANEIQEEFKKELNDFFSNEFFKIFLCIIIELFNNNLKEILDGNYKKDLKKNEKIISQKAEKALKYITQKLKDKLLEELEKYFPEKKKLEDSNSDSFNFINDMNFPDYSEENNF